MFLHSHFNLTILRGTEKCNDLWYNLGGDETSPWNDESVDEHSLNNLGTGCPFIIVSSCVIVRVSLLMHIAVPPVVIEMNGADEISPGCCLVSISRHTWIVNCYGLWMDCYSSISRLFKPVIV